MMSNVRYIVMITITYVPCLRAFSPMMEQISTTSMPSGRHTTGIFPPQNRVGGFIELCMIYGELQLQLVGCVKSFFPGSRTPVPWKIVMSVCNDSM